jgi:hypothetical protein
VHVGREERRLEAFATVEVVLPLQT